MAMASPVKQLSLAKMRSDQSKDDSGHKDSQTQSRVDTPVKKKNDDSKASMTASPRPLPASFAKKAGSMVDSDDPLLNT